MKSIIILLSILLFGNVGMQAQTTTVKEVFKAMPDSLVPYLSANSRLDFIDFLESNMEARVTNELNGKSIMTTLNDSFLSLQLNEASHLQMRLLPVTDPVDGMQQIVCLVQTFGVTARESVVSFYSCSWRPLNEPMLVKPSIDELLQCPADMNSDRFSELKAMLQPYLIEAQLSPSDNSIVWQLSPPVITSDDKEDILRVLFEKTVNWMGNSFK